MRTVVRWFVGFLGLWWNIFVFFFMVVPVAMVAGMLWTIYTIVLGVGAGVLAGWGIYQIFPIWWVSVIVGLVLAILYWWTLRFIYTETDGWPYEPGEKLVLRIMQALPFYER